MSKKIMVFDSNNFGSKYYTGILSGVNTWIEIEDAEQKKSMATLRELNYSNLFYSEGDDFFHSFCVYDNTSGVYRPSSKDAEGAVDIAFSIVYIETPSDSEIAIDKKFLSQKIKEEYNDKCEMEKANLSEGTNKDDLTKEDKEKKVNDKFSRLKNTVDDDICIIETNHFITGMKNGKPTYSSRIIGFKNPGYLIGCSSKTTSAPPMKKVS